MMRAWLLVLAACSGSSAPCKTVAACKAECDDGGSVACQALGKLYLNAKPLDLAGAAAAFDKACKAGRASSCAALALQVQDGRGVPWDQDKARELYDRACEGGAGVGCYNLALMYNDGNGVPHDRARAEQYMTRAHAAYQVNCAVDPSWCVNLGFLYEEGMVGSAPDFAKAAEWDRRGCDRGDSPACASLSMLELDGRGVAKNRDAALSRLEHECTAGGSLACGVLGRAQYEDVEHIPPRAAELIVKSCDLGDPQSCSMASGLFALGRGTAVDETKAFDYGTRGCDLGNSTACLANGEAIAQSKPADAAELFLRACHIGNPEGCMERVRLAVEGRATAKPDEVEALVERACRLGLPAACALLEKK